MKTTKLIFFKAVIVFLITACGSDSESTNESEVDDASEEYGADLDNATEIMGDLAICINVHNLVMPQA